MKEDWRPKCNSAMSNYPFELGQFLTFSIRGKLYRFERERPLCLRLRGLTIACSALRAMRNKVLLPRCRE